MQRMTLGKTGLSVSRIGFGALPLQRISRADAGTILRAAYEGGITFYDTARGYFDSESKIGEALGDVRERIVIATKSTAADAKGLEADLCTSLGELHTSYVDIYQFHVAKKCHCPGEADGLYDAALRMRDEGRIRHIGITAHRRDVALDAAASGLYETVQYPMSYLSSNEDLKVPELCARHNVGFIAMKGLSGGLITSAELAVAFMNRYPEVLPIWGIQKMAELGEFLSLAVAPPLFDTVLAARIERDKLELAGNFCRGCGYCLPCPANIEISWIARMKQAMRRMDPAFFMAEEWRGKVKRVKACIQCGACRARCPYELNPPELMASAYDDYFSFADGWDARGRVDDSLLSD